MTDRDYTCLKAQLAILKDVAKDYGGKTIENIIHQMEARVKEVEV